MKFGELAIFLRGTHVFKVVCCVLFFLLVFVFLFFILKKVENRSVVFESRESKNTQGSAVLNKISFEEINNQEVWNMRQNHNSEFLSIKSNDWNNADAISIRVNKKERKATFQQWEPFVEDGSNIERKEREYSVSCGLCHSNGPRVVRPNWSSQRAPLSWLDKATIVSWNVRIKFSGMISTAETGSFVTGVNRANIVKRTKFVNLPGDYWNAPLKIESCEGCHVANEESGAVSFVGFLQRRFLLRNALSKQNFLSIEFMLSQNAMPPMLHKVKSQDLNTLKRVIHRNF